MTSAVAFVPARWGSERVRGKNVRPLAGHPLLAYAIATAKQSGVFQRVVVSTDSEETAEIGRWYGAKVPFLRPPELATATSPDIEWLTFTVERLDDIADDLIVTARKLLAEDGRLLYEFALHAGGRELVRGRAAVVLAAGQTA